MRASTKVWSHFPWLNKVLFAFLETLAVQNFKDKVSPGYISNFVLCGKLWFMDDKVQKATIKW